MKRLFFYVTEFVLWFAMACFGCFYANYCYCLICQIPFCPDHVCYSCPLSSFLVPLCPKVSRAEGLTGWALVLRCCQSTFTWIVSSLSSWRVPTVNVPILSWTLSIGSPVSKKLYHRNIGLIIINNYLTYRCRLCIKIPPTHLVNKTEINRKSTF